ncbi:MAG: hypothetical protein IPL65_12845 [Lewinellaceae bacterium]|nr:hypothetical protein [Lewinellaceae bacterium]
MPHGCAEITINTVGVRIYPNPAGKALFEGKPGWASGPLCSAYSMPMANAAHAVGQNANLNHSVSTSTALPRGRIFWARNRAGDGVFWEVLKEGD